MDIHCTLQETLNKLRATRHFFETLFPKSIPLARRGLSSEKRSPFLTSTGREWMATKILSLHHDAFNILGRTDAKSRTNILRAKASAAHAAEPQVQVATLESKLANPVDKIPGVLALKSRGSVNTRPQNLSHLFLRR